VGLGELLGPAFELATGGIGLFVVGEARAAVFLPLGLVPRSQILQRATVLLHVRRRKATPNWFGANDAARGGVAQSA
jgi:hypothetical protein